MEENDLTSQKEMSENIRKTLEEVLEENQELIEKIADMEGELKQSEEFLEHTRDLVEILTEIIIEGTPEDNASSKTLTVEGRCALELYFKENHELHAQLSDLINKLNKLKKLVEEEKLRKAGQQYQE